MIRRIEMAEGWLRTPAYCALGLLGVALLTFIGFRLHASLTTATFCYLLLLVLQSLSGDFVGSVVVASAGVLFLDYFFVEPLFSFQSIVCYGKAPSRSAFLRKSSTFSHF